MGKEANQPESGVMMGFMRLPRVEGPITTAIRAAIRLRVDLLHGGAEEGEADRIVGQGLKGAMGNSRAIPWRFYCEKCKDTGWIDIKPTGDDAERLMRLYGTLIAQTYEEPCEPCLFRQKQREERRRIFGNDDSDMESAGQTRKRWSK